MRIIGGEFRIAFLGVGAFVAGNFVESTRWYAGVAGFFCG